LGQLDITQSCIGEKKLFMVYRTDVVLPLEITKGSPHVVFYDEAMQDQIWRDNLGFLKGQRRQSTLGVSKYEQALRHYHQWFIRKQEFQVGDLVLKHVLKGEGRTKLSPTWGGSYMVTEVCHPSCFRLATKDGIPLPQSPVQRISL
jgi:hypothetical protein